MTLESTKFLVTRQVVHIRGFEGEVLCVVTAIVVQISRGQHINEWSWLCSAYTLFIKPCSGTDLAPSLSPANLT